MLFRSIAAGGRTGLTSVVVAICFALSAFLSPVISAVPSAATAGVPSHLHLNVSYLLEADEEEVLRIKPDENSGVRWFFLEEALAACSEPWMIERVYKKLNAKVRERFGGTYGMQRGE